MNCSKGGRCGDGVGTDLMMMLLRELQEGGRAAVASRLFLCATVDEDGRRVCLNRSRVIDFIHC